MRLAACYCSVLKLSAQYGADGESNGGRSISTLAISYATNKPLLPRSILTAASLCRRQPNQCIITPRVRQQFGQRARAGNRRCYSGRAPNWMPS